MYDKLEDRSFVGKIPVCKGVIAFGSTLKECQNELRSTLEDWILLGLKLRHRLPVIDNIDLNQQTAVGTLREPIGVNLSSNPVRDCCLTIKSRSPLAPLKKGGTRADQSPPS